MPGYIKLHRSIRNNWIYVDAEYLKVWLEMLFSARYEEEPKTDIYNGIIYTVSYGEFIFGYPSWSERLNIGQQRLRTLVKQLLSSNMIVLKKKHSKFTIYKIVNFEKFNKQDNNLQGQQSSDIDGDANKQDNKQPTSSQQAANKQPTSSQQLNKNIKNKKEGKEHKDYYLEIENFRQRYSPNTLKIIDRYIDILKTTRVSGKIADSVMVQVYTEMSKHPEIVVEYACKTVVDNPSHHSKRENYLYGIMRNTKADEAQSKLERSQRNNDSWLDKVGVKDY